MEKTNKFRKRITLYVIILTMIISVIVPYGAIQTVSAASLNNGILQGEKATTRIGDRPKGSDGKEYVHPSMTVMDFYPSGIRIEQTTKEFKWYELIGKDSRGKESWMYCVELWPVFNSNGYNSSNINNSSYLGDEGTLVKGLNKLADEKNIKNLNGRRSRNFMLMATIYGWQPIATMPQELKDKKLNSWDWFFGTQVVMWEFQQGIRQTPTQRSGNGFAAGDALYKSLKGRPAEHAYNYILKMMGQHYTIPSFSMEDKVSAPTHTLNWSETNKRYETTLTDTSGYLFNLNLSGSGINVKKSGNKYTFWTTKDISTPQLCSMSKDIKIDPDQKLLVWGNAGKQSMVTGMNDPVQFFFKLQTTNPKISIKKTGTTAGDIKGKIFDIFLGSSSTPCLTITTDTSGNASGNLPGAGTYKIVERNSSQYNVTYTIGGQAKQTFTYPSNDFVNNNITVNVNNSVKNGKLQIKKTSDDGIVAGFTFRIYGTALNGSSVDIYETTNASGNIDITLLPGNYTVEETNVPGRYSQPAARKVIVTADQITVVSVKNELKKATLKLIKTSTDGKIDGLQFRVQGTDITGKPYDKTFTTKLDGTITENIPQGTYTVTEVNIPNKYYTPNSQTVTLTGDETKTITFNNVLKPGRMQLRKASEDGIVEGFRFLIESIDDPSYSKISFTNPNGYLTFSEPTIRRVTGLNGSYTFGMVDYYDLYCVNKGMTLKEFKDLLNDQFGIPGDSYDIVQADGFGALNLSNAITDPTTVISDVYAEVKIGDPWCICLLSDGNVIGVLAVTGTSGNNGLVGTWEISTATIYLGQPITYDQIYAPLLDIDGDGVITANDLTLLQNAYDNNGGLLFVENYIDLPAGAYKITELDVPSRYTSGFSSTVTLIAGETININLTNHLKTSGAFIAKTSQDGIVEGFDFRIQGLTIENAPVDITVTTGPDGTAAQKLPLGTYTVTEINIPCRYNNPAPQTITLTDEDYIILEFDNTLKPGTGKIKKTSQDGVVSGVKFNIKSLSTADGSTLDITETTNLSGEIIKELPVGTYKIAELDVPDRYEPQGEYFIEILPGQTTAITVANILKVPELTVAKISEDGFIESIKFSVKGTAATGEEIDITLITGEDGTVTADLPQGTYTIVEIDTEGRYIAPDPQTITLKNDESIVLTFENILKTCDLEIIKTSEDGVVADIEFYIFGITTTGEQIGLTAKTDADGKINMDLKPGIYNISEVMHLDRYIISQEQEVTLAWDNPATVTFINILKKARITVTKHETGSLTIATNDEDNEIQEETQTSEEPTESEMPISGIAVAGAVYGLYDNNGELLGKYTTNNNGRFTTDAFIVDEGYYIQEIEAPYGYWIDETKYYLDLQLDELFLEITELTLDVFDSPIVGNILIIKKMGLPEDSEYEAGAVFDIYLKSAGSYENADEMHRDRITTEQAQTAEENYRGEATPGGTAGTKDLPAGIYVVHQVIGAEGYAYIEDFEVEINANQTTFEYELLDIREIPTEIGYPKIPNIIPDTGHSQTSITILGAIISLASCGIGILIFFKQKKAK